MPDREDVIRRLDELRVDHEGAAAWWRDSQQDARMAEIADGASQTLSDALTLLREQGWRPMSEHTFPWEPSRLLVAARRDDDGAVDVYLCTCADGGHYYPECDGIPIALDEDGWTPFAWSVALPPLLEGEGK